MKQRISIDKTIPNTGVLDFSNLLDGPAGKHGFTVIRNGHLYFEDGTRARFIGFNMPTRANTPDHDTAERLADRLASLGANVVRLHAFDAPMGEKGWSSSLNNPVIDYNKGNSRTFHEKGMDRFDYFVSKLKEKGIYLHIDLFVTRVFMEGDMLDYRPAPAGSFKSANHYNERLIELQKEYATNLLCHVNPYTGMALIDDPAVMTIQVNNEDSVIKGTGDIKDTEWFKPYREELQRRFNHYLLYKYDTRANLAKAWTFNGTCALGNNEDPEKGTVYFPEGDFYQVPNDPMGDWAKDVSPARYADFMEFAISINRKYYRTMIDHIKSLGARVPVVTSNLYNGAADVYSHSDGDIMENNTYFNHPIPPFDPKKPVGAEIREYVSSNPLKVHTDGIYMRTNMLPMASMALISGKPFILSEWNEYGLNPFHSTAFVSMTSYACLNDWDGLIVYCYHTSENWGDQPADEITDIFDAYNDPSLICQFGFMSKLFLNGLVKKAVNHVDIVYTQNDLLTLPPAFSMPYTYLPYVTGVRSVFLDQGDIYQGDADAAVTAGYVNDGDLSQAKHAVYFAWSPYRDAMRRSAGPDRLKLLAKNKEELLPGVKLGNQELVFEDINALAGSGDYTGFARAIDAALKSWGILESSQGLVNGAFVSDTDELSFDPDAARFTIRTPKAFYFSGHPEGNEVKVSETVTLKLRNNRISIALLPLGTELIRGAGAFLLTMLGPTGMDQTEYRKDGYFTVVDMAGKLYVDTAEGELLVDSEAAALTALSMIGEPIAQIKGVPSGKGMSFKLEGDYPAVHYLITLGNEVK